MRVTIAGDCFSRRLPAMRTQTVKTAFREPCSGIGMISLLSKADRGDTRVCWSDVSLL